MKRQGWRKKESDTQQDRAEVNTFLGKKGGTPLRSRTTHVGRRKMGTLVYGVGKHGRLKTSSDTHRREKKNGEPSPAGNVRSAGYGSGKVKTTNRNTELEP